MQRRKRLSALAAAFGMAALIFDGKTAVQAAVDGIKICLFSVVPSLFPFLLLSAILVDSLWGSQSVILRYAGNLFHMPPGASALLVPALLGGYPAGAKSIADAYRNRCLEEEDANNLMRFCSNIGPAYIFGMMHNVFEPKILIWPLWGIQICSAWYVSLIYPANTKRYAHQKTNRKSDYMTSTILAMAKVCGWIVIAKTMIGLCDHWFLRKLSAELRVYVTGLLELSNGCIVLNTISNVNARFIIASGILSFGGVSVALQTHSVIGGLPIKPYLHGKCLQYIFSTVFAILYVKKMWIVMLAILGITVLFTRVSRKNSSIRENAVV